jgi:sphinganine-1-phosphate aldolase
LNVEAPIDGGDDMERVLVAAFQRYCVSNPLHPDVFPAIRQMEAEIVAMCLRMYNNPTGAGATTSGGTESILMSVKTHRDWARAVKGISEPEMYANSFRRLYAERVHRTHPG